MFAYIRDWVMFAIQFETHLFFFILHSISKETGFLSQNVYAQL